MTFDLLTTVEYGGCSAKLSAQQLNEALKCIPPSSHPNLLVDISTHDDAGVYKINDECAIIQTVDFFPPVCSDPFEFGEIAATNALSDVYAMGGEVLTAMNIVMFPSSRIPLAVLTEILKGGQKKVSETEGVMAGGHTIDDYPPKYGLSVTGIVHPDRIITNAAAKPGDKLILTKPIGTGIIVAGKRIGEVDERNYRDVIDSMKLLNRKGAQIMRAYAVRSATDVTGFGLIGHALTMAKASGVTFRINSATVPLFNGVYELADLGCLPGACFRNLEFAEHETSFGSALDYNRKMAICDPQTSGGLFISATPNSAEKIVRDMRLAGYVQTAIIGEVIPREENALRLE